jgi:hypothetical protein
VPWLLIAVVALVLGVATAFEIRGALEREREFRAAPTCASVPVKASRCLWKQEFTVRKADAHRGERNASPEAELLLPSGMPWKVTFPQTDPVVSEMEPDDKVVGLIWHGQVVEVRDADGQRQQTSSGPVGQPEDRLGGALACISIGLTALVGGLWPLFAPGKRRHAKAAYGRSRRSGGRSRCSPWHPWWPSPSLPSAATSMTTLRPSRRYPRHCRRHPWADRTGQQRGQGTLTPDPG